MNIVMQLIYYVLVIFNILFFLRAILSWFPDMNWGSAPLRLLYDVTEPVLRPIRNALPRNINVDISPLVASIIIYVLISVLF